MNIIFDEKLILKHQNLQLTKRRLWCRFGIKVIVYFELLLRHLEKLSETIRVSSFFAKLMYSTRTTFGHTYNIDSSEKKIIIK